MKNLILPAALLVVASSAFSQAIRFHSATANVDSSGTLTVTFDERGLGNNANIDYLLTGNGSAVYACVNKGGNHPQATNKTDSVPISQVKTVSSDKNGRIVSSFTVAAPGPGNFSCPSGQGEPVLACVSYTSLLLKDTTNDVSIVPTGNTSATVDGTIRGVSCS